MRKTWMKIGLIAAVAAASWAGNLWYFRSHQLGEAWFLDHHIEVYKSNGEQFPIYYLEDLQASRKPRMILFPEHPDFRAKGPYPDVQFTHQQLNRFEVMVERPFSEEEGEARDHPPRPLRIIVYYEDGTSETRTIGKVHVMNRPSGGEESLVQGTSAGASSDGTGYHFYTLQRPAKLTKLTSEYMQLFRDGRIEAAVDFTGASHTILEAPSPHGTIKLLGSAIAELKLPVPIQASGQLRLSYSVRRNELPADSMYRILLKAELEEPGTGHRKTLRSEAAAFINILPSLTEDDVRSLARERRKEQ